MIFSTYLHARDAFIRASQRHLPSTIIAAEQSVNRFTANERLEIIKEIVHEQNVVEHDDFLQILFFAIEYHDQRVANNWNIIKYLIEDKKVCPGKVILEEYEYEDSWGQPRWEVYQNLIIDFILRQFDFDTYVDSRRGPIILEYLLKHDGTNSLLEQFMKYYIGDGTADSQMKILPLRLNRQTFGVIRNFAEHFGKQFQWYHNTKMMLSFLNQLGLKYDYQHLTNHEKNLLMEIMDLLQEYLEKALNERKQIGSDLPIPGELASLVFEYF